MAKYTAKALTFNLTITGSANGVAAEIDSYEIKEGRALEDSSGFGEHQNYIEGQNYYEVTINAWFGVSGSTSGIFNLLRIAKANVLPITITVQPNSNSKTFSGVFTFDEYTVSGEKKGSPIKLGKVTFKPANGNAEPSWN